MTVTLSTKNNIRHQQQVTSYDTTPAHPAVFHPSSSYRKQNLHSSSTHRKQEYHFSSFYYKETEKQAGFVIICFTTKGHLWVKQRMMFGTTDEL
jgi:hypothetical protein